MSRPRTPIGTSPPFCGLESTQTVLSRYVAGIKMFYRGQRCLGSYTERVSCSKRDVMPSTRWRSFRLSPRKAELPVYNVGSSCRACTCVYCGSSLNDVCTCTIYHVIILGFQELLKIFTRRGIAYIHQIKRGPGSRIEDKRTPSWSWSKGRFAFSCAKNTVQTRCTLAVYACATRPCPRLADLLGSHENSFFTCCCSLDNKLEKLLCSHHDHLAVW